MFYFNLLFIAVFFGLFSIGQLQRITINTDINFYLHDLIIIILIILNGQQLINFLIKKIKTVKFTQFKLEIFFLIWLMVGLIRNSFFSGLELLPFLYLSRLFIYSLFTLLLKLYQLAIQKKWPSLKIIKVIRLLYLIAALYILFFGWLQYIFIPDTRFLFILGWNDHYYRLISTQLDPNFTGLILLLAWLYLQTMTLITQNKFRIFTSFLLITGIAFTFSRASYLALFMCLIVLIIKYFLDKNKIIFRLFLLYLIFFLGLIPFLPKPAGEGVKLERTASIQARALNAQQYFHQISGIGDWLIGKGFFTRQDNLQTENHHQTSGLIIPQHANVPDNILILFLSYTGIIGTVLIVLIFWKWEKILFEKDFYLFLAFAAVLIHSNFNNSLFQPFIFLMLLAGFI